MRWSWIPWVGYAIEMGKNPTQLLQESAKMFSREGVFGLIIGGNRFFIITENHNSNVIFRSSKSLGHYELHSAIMDSCFNIKPDVYHALDDNYTRKLFTTHLFRYDY